MMLVQTCSSVPEQYDLLDEAGEQVAYLRLRFGVFAVYVPDSGGTVVYSHHFTENEWKGEFDDDADRAAWLTAGIAAALAQGPYGPAGAAAVLDLAAELALSARRGEE